jgi:hypothetical protein
LLPTNSAFCRRLAERIQKIEDRIQERIGQLDENPLDLPETCAGDDVQPSSSRRGHRRLINEDKQLLAQRRGEYSLMCFDDPDDPFLPPAFNPVPQTSPQADTQTRQQQAAAAATMTGLLILAGMLILAF